MRDRIVAAAKKYADARGWTWLLPIQVALTRAVPNDRQWTVKTNASAVGMNARIVVREHDLSVVEGGYMGR